MSAFDQAIDLLLQPGIEGGYSNDPQDPGGETNFGISKRAYPGLDIKSVTRDYAIAIYRMDYWDALRCDDLPPSLAVCLFDGAVNQGKKAAVKLMQRSLNVMADGVFGPQTLKAAINAQAANVDNFMARRCKRYAESDGFDRNAGGWLGRVMKFHRLAITL